MISPLTPVDILHPLRAASGALHHALDTQLPISRDGASLQDYVRHLRTLRPWLQDIRQALAAPRLAALDRVAARIGQRIEALELDLGDAAAGGPSALNRLERDVIGLSGVVAVIWFEGTNDVRNGSPASFLIAGIQRGVAALRERIPGVRVLQATMTTDRGSANNTPEIRARREEVNVFIRGATIFDGVVDFDAATIDPATFALRLSYLANSTTGVVDYLHPNRAGYLAMGNAGNLELLTGIPVAVPAVPVAPTTPAAT